MANNSTMRLKLQFDADVSQALTQMQKLSASLNEITKSNAVNAGPGLHLTKDLQEATIAAAQLQNTLNKTVNVNTGKLDLTKFNQELQKSGMSLEKYQQVLSKAGPAGKQAFAQLTQSIATAEVKTIHLSDRLAKLGQTLANTVRWQISTTILNGFISSVQTAYRHVQDLNESLNEIRIVTGYSIDKMDKFAEKANKAAKALHTTTTEYTNASLIYYQQGLSEKEVEKRTQLTIKMANVTGQSAQEVSNQLTAVWNNFYDGTQSLEHYIDVMTALGAATASSSEEISEGLNKFAAVAETVGLSYEYAASALATVTATTRESADIVGNAFKTLFARIQGLNLGETLDDGTTLNKYSAALAKVGINIQTASGEMKAMDTILDELGAKWNTLGRAEQTALAQTVAGVRQYTQLIALMENWDYFKENLNIAMTSEGELDRQAKIYAEGWEAARDKVTAALEGIYQKLLDDDAFIGILNFFEKFLTTISNVIDSLGGVNGVLTLIGTTLTTVFQKQAAAGMSSFILGVRSLLPGGKKATQDLQTEANDLLAKNYDTSSKAGALQATSAKSMGEANQSYLTNAQRLNDSQKEILRTILQQQQALAGAAIEQGEVAAEAERTQKILARPLKQNFKSEIGQSTLIDQDQENALNQAGINIQSGDIKRKSVYTRDATGKVTGVSVERTLNDSGKVKNQLLNTMTSAYQQSSAAAQLSSTVSLDSGDFDVLTSEGAGDTEKQTAALNEIQTRLKNLGVTADNVSKEIADIIGPEISKEMQDYAKAIQDATQKTKELDQANDELKKAQASGNPQAIANATAKQNTALKAQEKALDGVADANNNLQTSIHKTGERAQIAQGALKAIGANAENVDAVADAACNTGRELGETAEAAGRARAGVDNVSEGAKVLNAQTPNKLSQGMMSLAQTIGSVSMAIQSVIGIFNVWNNQDMSVGEKLLSTFSTLAMVIPLVTMALDKNNIAQLAGLAAAIAHALGLSTEATAASIAAGATATFGTVLYTVLWPIGLVMLAVAALVGIIMGLVAIFQKFADAARADEIALENANKKVEALTDSYNELKNAANELKTAISDYNDAITALDDLEKGTKEYKEALAEANEKAKELIETYELFGDYEYKNGVIVIDQTALSNAQSKADEAARIAETALYSAKIRANNLDFKVNKYDVSESTIKQVAKVVSKLESAGEDVQVNAVMLADKLQMSGVITGSALSELQEAIAESDGNFIDLADSIYDVIKANQYYIEQIMGNAAEDVYSDVVAKLATDKEGNVNHHMEQLLNNAIVAITKQGKASDKTNATNSEVIKSIQSHLESASTQTTDWDAGDAYEKAMKKAVSQAGYDLVNIYGQIFKGKSYDGNMSTQEMLKDWAEAQGYQNVHVEDKSGENVLTYTDMQGNSQEITLSNAESQEKWGSYIASTVVDMFSEKKMLNTMSTQEAEQIFGTIIQNGEQYGTNWSEALIAGVANKGEFDFSGLFSELSPSEHKELTEELTDQQIAALFGLNEYSVSKLGPNVTIEKFANAFRKGLTDWDVSAYADARNAAGEAAAEDFDIDIDEFKTYRDLLLDANQAYEDNVEGLNNVALANKRMQKGVQSLADDWSDFDKVIRDETPSLVELSSILPKINTALQDILNLDIEQFSLLPPTFAKDHWDLIQAVVNGVDGAVDVLRNTAGQEILLNVTGKEAFDELDYVLQYIHNKILAADKNQEFEVGVDITDEEFISACNNIITTAKMTAEQAEAYFQSLGYNVIPVTDKNGFATAIEIITPNGSYGGGLGVDTTALGIERDTKNLEDELERYHLINECLDDLNRQYDILSDAKNRAFGADKLALMDAEIAKTEQLIAAQKDYLAEAQAYFDADRKVLLGYGASTDAAGRVSNYEDLITAWVNQYNSGQISEDEYDKRIQALENYEDSLNTLEEQQKAVIDLENQMIDLSMEKIEYKVELEIKIIDNELVDLEYQLEHLDDPFYDAADALAIMGEQMNQNIASIEVYRNGIRKTLGEILSEEELTALLDNGDLSVLEGKSLTAKQIEMLEQYRDALYETNRAIDEFIPNIQEKITGAFEAANEEMQESITALEHLGSIVETYENIVDIVGQDMLGVTNETLRQLNRAGIDNAMAQLKANKEMLDFNKQALADAEAARAQAIAEGNTEAVKAWDETIKTITAEVQSMEQTVGDSLQSVLEQAAEDFEKAVSAAVSEFEKAMSGIYGSFEQLQKAFDQQNTLNKKYVADYKKIYELSKLNRDIANSIDETDNVRAKQLLRDLEEEALALQESSEQVSEYRLEHLRKEYELRLAQIALEEAQNAKNQVRMQRDAEGNWSYIYTADENAIANAQQNYEDALYAIQEYTQNYIESTQETILQLQIDYVNELSELRLSDFANVEEYEAAKARITEYYSELIDFNISELENSISDSAEIYNNDWRAYSDATGYKLSDNHLWISDFNQTVLAQTTGFQTLEAYQNAYKASTIPLLNDLSKAFNNWSTDVDTAMRNAGLDVDAFNRTVKITALSISGETQNITNSFSLMVSGAKNAFSSLVSAATGQLSSYQNALLLYKNENQAIIDQLNAIIRLRGEVTGEDIIPPGAEDNKGLGFEGNPNYYSGGSVPFSGNTEEDFESRYKVISTDETGQERDFMGTGSGSGYTSKEAAMSAAKSEFFSRIPSSYTDEQKEEKWQAVEPSLSVVDFGYQPKDATKFNVKGHYVPTLDASSKYITITKTNVKNLKRRSPDEPYSIEQTVPRNGTIPLFISEDDASKILTEFGLDFTPIKRDQDPPWEKGDTVRGNPASGGGKTFKTYSNPDNPSFWNSTNMPVYEDTYNETGYKKYTILDKKTIDGTNWYKITDNYWCVGVNLASYDTGGYTGSWDSTGRLAMLHQKEIVLNADDTINFLNAIEIVRDIARVIDLNAASQANAFNMIAATSSQGSQILEQQVTIHAEFPNATNRTEIEAAFDNLVNKASQFANRKNK